MKRQSNSLDGRWQIAFDQGNVGKQRRWMEWESFVASAPREYVDVPACWERFRQDYEGVAWYAHEFTVPGEWQGSSIRIHFGAVNYLAEVYVNDQAIGYHEGGYTDFWFEIGDLVRFAEPNTLILRVIGPILTQDKEIDGIGRDDMPHWRGAIAGGIWQSVTLRASAPVYVADVFADPDLPHRCVHAHIAIENISEMNRDLSVRLRVMTLGITADPMPSGEPTVEQAISCTAKPGQTSIALDLDMPLDHLWSPSSPFLYRLEADLFDNGEIIDSRKVRFGMRQFLIQEDGYYLNERKLMVKSAFFEGLYPTTLAAPPHEAFARRELQLAKDAGFNLIRPWRKPQPPIVYDLADELGLLFVGTMPIECMDRWPTMTPYAERRMKNEVRESVRRDRNHPCIIMWEIFNEIMRPALQRIKPQVSREARQLDPSRIILDESGGFGGGASIYPPHSTESFQINDVHDYPGAPFDEEGYERMLALAKTDAQLLEMGIERPKKKGRSKQSPGRFTHVSEIGYGSLPDLEANVAQYRRQGNPLTPDYRYHHDLLDHFGRALTFAGLTDIYPTVRDFCLATQEIHAAANKLMVEAIRMNPDVSGFTIHAYTDGDWVIGAGLLDLFRNPKKAYYAAQETNQPIYLALRTSQRNVYGPDEVALTASVVSEREEAFEARLQAQVTGSDGRIVGAFERDVQVSPGVSTLLAQPLNTEGLEGRFTFRAQLACGADLVTKNSYAFRVIPRHSIAMPQVEIAVCDPSDVLTKALTTRSVPAVQFDVDTPHTTLVLANARALQANAEGEIGSALTTFVRAGGTVAYLDIPAGTPKSPEMRNLLLAADWLPVQLCLRHTRGLWTPFAHVIRDHAVSCGLPAGKAMDQDYAHVYPLVSIVRVAEADADVPFVGLDLWSWLGEDAARAPIGTLGLDWRRGALSDDLDYRGPGPVIYGADLIDWPCGEGYAVLCTLRLLENLNRDPIADRLLANIITWAAGLRQRG